MSWYPFNPLLGQIMQTAAPGVTVDAGYVAHYVASPAAAAVDSVLAATALADGAATTVATGITAPDVPRALQIKGNAAGITGDVVITGTNFAGETISETIALNGANAVLGSKAFKTVTQIVLPARNAAGDTVSVGCNDKLGIPYKLALNTVLAAYLDGAKEGTAPTVAVSATALESNTIDLNSALAGKQVDVFLIA
jgi:hypothetical protein